MAGLNLSTCLRPKCLRPNQGLAYVLYAFFQFFGLLCVVSSLDVCVGDMKLLLAGIVVLLILLLRYYLGCEPACSLVGNGDASAVVDCKKMC